MNEVASEKARQGMVREALADVLLDRAAWASARLHAGRTHGVELHEETVTQDLLLDIAQALPSMTARTFTKKEESRNGADWQWEWWFRGRQWFGLRIQAKRLKRLRNGILGYDLGYFTGPKRQVDILINQARSDGIRAAYALYNGPDLDIGKFSWGCGHLPASPVFFGVSLLPARVARDLVNARTVDMSTVAAKSRPWSCLVSCDPTTGCNGDRWRRRPWWPPSIYDTEPHEDLAVWVATSFYRILIQTAYGGESVEGQAARLERLVTQSLTQQRVPRYLGALLNEVSPDQVLPPTVRTLTVFSGSELG
ncbi:hypothetical protein OHA72_22520 [Dactylosporangium sp. NBC_01737]|uniref:DUF6615 family protein n=1 Tax=Dactylosporangium sp. NBC_01737 TaxID=2975959 RepID=UPI002E0D1495|nr:hypothetical protein OHA72_22520 [Dactylosporangium sp. NBC_01737]